MRRACLLLLAWSGLAAAAAGATEPAAAAFEARIAAAVQSDQITVVHLWAPWCPNCQHELAHHGWSNFLAANPAVKFIFITIWNDQEGAEVLAKNGVGAQKNLTVYLHPNPSRHREDQVTALLGLPITWIPTTWVFEKGKLRYALNYGELRFPILQQMIADSSSPW
jgi:thiol-disulfide isomerase/thioredoxin